MEYCNIGCKSLESLASEWYSFTIGVEFKNGRVNVPRKRNVWFTPGHLGHQDGFKNVMYAVSRKVHQHELD